MKLDIEAIAREAVSLVDLPMHLCGTADWQVKFRQRFAALLLEKAAQVCEGMHEEDRPGDYAYAILSMSAGMGE